MKPRKTKQARLQRRKVSAAVPSTNGGFSPSWSGNTTGLYQITKESTQRGWRPDLDRDASALITRYKHRAMLSDARYVFTGIGQVSGAIRDKANFAVGDSWVPQYLGKDVKFKAKFNEVICGSWMRNCDLRGAPYNWQTNVWMASVCLDRDGEVFIALTESERGSPRLQFLEAQRIGGDGEFGKVPESAGVQPFYKGKTICNGIVYDDFMRAIGYNVLPAEKPWSYSAHEWNIIDAASIIHVFDPQWFSQNRGIPTICNGILDWYDIGEIRDAEKIGVKAASRIALLEYNENGIPNQAAAAMAAKSTGDPTQIQLNHTLIESGLIRYFKAQSGSKLEAFASSRPSATWQGFVEHVARSAHRGMDWPIEMHDMSKLGGASVRAVVGQVQRAIGNRQAALWLPMLSAVLYAVSYYIKRGSIPFATDWFNVGFTKPAQFSVDVGRDSQNRRQDVAMGLRGIDDVFGEEGEGDVEAVFQRRADIYKTLEDVARRNNVPKEAIFNPASASVQAAATIGEGTVWSQQDQQGVEGSQGASEE